ncbi:MAG: TrmB family transcriptional regulator [Roseiflexaceae bacterium]
MADNVALLQPLGFGDYEARAYIALLQRSPLNGYELAKASGVPRSNIYPVLRKLEERGAVVRLEMPSGARYAPVPPQELVARLGNRFQQALDAAQRSLEALSTPAENAYVWNLRGQTALLDHAHTLLDAVQKRLLVAIARPDAAALAEPLAQAEAREVEMTTLCLDTCTQECGNCRGNICPHCVALDEAPRWLVLVVDGTEVLAGERGDGDEVVAVRTRQPLLVNLVSWYIWHSIALATMLNDLNDRLERALDPETRARLQAVGPSEPGGGWLEYMRQLLSQRRG